METLLTVAIVVIALAVIVQAGVLVGMYLMSRRLTDKAELIMNESMRLIPPLESITSNMKSATTDMSEVGKLAHSQVLQLQQMLNETQENVREQITEVREIVLETVAEARTVVMRPVREYSAIATGIVEGVRTFFKGRKAEEPDAQIVVEEIIIDKQRPAA